MQTAADVVLGCVWVVFFWKVVAKADPGQWWAAALAERAAMVMLAVYILAGIGARHGFPETTAYLAAVHFGYVVLAAIAISIGLDSYGNSRASKGASE